MIHFIIEYWPFIVTGFLITVTIALDRKNKRDYYRWRSMGFICSYTFHQLAKRGGEKKCCICGERLVVKGEK
jgi:hypothetical protein